MISPLQSTNTSDIASRKLARMTELLQQVAENNPDIEEPTVAVMKVKDSGKRKGSSEFAGLNPSLVRWDSWETEKRAQLI